MKVSQAQKAKPRTDYQISSVILRFEWISVFFFLEVPKKSLSSWTHQKMTFLIHLLWLGTMKARYQGFYVYVCVLVCFCFSGRGFIDLVKWKLELCPTLCDPMDYTVRGILQARILEWEPFPFSRWSSQPRYWTQVSHIAGRFFTKRMVDFIQSLL